MVSLLLFKAKSVKQTKQTKIPQQNKNTRKTKLKQQTDQKKPQN